MRTALLAGILLLGFAAPGFAQVSPGQQGQQAPYWSQQRGDEDGQQGEIGPWQHMMRGQRNMQGMMMMARELGAGAFFRFRRGNDEVDVHCPPNQPIQDCVNAAGQLMRTLQQSGSPGTTGQPQR